MKTKPAIIAFLAAFTAQTLAEEIPYERYRGYRSERTAEQDLAAYKLQQHQIDLANGKIADAGTYEEWRICYSQASSGLTTTEYCDSTVNNEERLQKWKAVEAVRRKPRAVEVYIEIYP